MLLNLAPLSRGGGYPMTRLYMWQRYQARCATAPLWKNVCNGTSVAKGWLWCCLLMSCVGFGYHTHCTLVITHIALWLSDTLQKATNLGQITLTWPNWAAAWKRSKKSAILMETTEREGGLSIIISYSFCLLFSLPNHWAAQASVFVFPMFPHHPWVVCCPPTIPALLSCTPHPPLLHHHHSTQADATKSLKKVSTGWAGGAQTLGTFSCLHSNSMWLGITLLTRWTVLVGWVHKEARFAINIVESICMES